MDDPFWQQLALVLADKGVLALLLVLAGLWANRRLEDWKAANARSLEAVKTANAREQARLEAELDHFSSDELRIAEARLPAFRALWELTAPASRAAGTRLDAAARAKLCEDIRAWYYKDGAGLFLDKATRDALFRAQNMLVDRDVDFDPLSPAPNWDGDAAHETLTRAFSAVRTEVKNALKIYGKVPGGA